MIGSAIAFVVCVASIGTFAPAARAAAVVRTSVAYRPVYHPPARPVVRPVGVAGGAAVTAAAVGTVVYSLPPSCTAVRIGEVAYQRCGSTWYRPAYSGTTVTYTVVTPPR
ncbi:MAG TPA: DUF6515 family protein [Polyangia bacterium]|jgi:hypothetical protein|nr:DUF6515 family protein [Polyangia bacterium]